MISLYNGVIKRSNLKYLSRMAIFSSALIVVTLIFISLTLRISFSQAVDLFEFRLFNASYDLPFSVINSDIVFFDIDSTGYNEFSNILHLWLKPIFKAFG